MKKNRRAAALISTGLLVAGILAGCSSSSTSAPKENDKGPITITLWSWEADLGKEAAEYKKTHPNITVNVVNQGSGGPEYNKVRDAIKAGTGAPDGFYTAGSDVRAFAQTKAIVPLDPYGVKSIKADLTPFSWSAGEVGGSQYYVPMGGGPMVYYYRADLFKKYHLTVPTTWAEFATEAAKLKAEAPSAYLASFPTLDLNFDGMVLQAGQHSFTNSGNSVKIQYNGPEGVKVANYWQGLLDKKLVSTAAELGTDWTQQLAHNQLISLVGAAWYPLVIEPALANQKGDWRVAQMPQWDAGKNASADAGLAGYAVTPQSKHPKATYDFIKWLGATNTGVTMQHSIQNFFPTYQPVLASDSFLNEKSDFFGGQQVNKEFVKAAEGVDPTQQFSPFGDYFDAQLDSAIPAAAAGTTTVPQALDKLQTAYVNYAKAQGFTVTK